MAALVQPQSIDITVGEDTRTYFLGKFPAIAGREILTQYPTTAMPKIGDYKTNEALMLKIMSFVGVESAEGNVLRLTTAALVDNHVPNAEFLMKIEWAMMERNFSFFANGKASNFFELVVMKVQALLTETLTDSLRPSSKTAKQPIES